MAERDDRTEAPSSRRLDRARADGNVPMSREVPTFAVLASAGLLLVASLPAMSAQALLSLQFYLANAHRMLPVEGLLKALWQVGHLAAPFALAALGAGGAAVLLQTGFLINLSAMLPALDRLDPRHGLARVFGIEPLMNAMKSLLKLAAIGWAGWSVLSGLLPSVGSAMLWQPSQLMAVTADRVAKLLFAMLAVQAVIAAADVVRARLKHSRGLRMSRQEVREEHREAEGDPYIKARLKQLRQQRARKRMMAAVPKAAVVITNPTHYAVALAYERGRSAPRVVAKGMDAVAARIRDVAQDARVPIVANPPLARALYMVPIDAEIGPEHYQMVAEVIAYVWRLRSRAQGVRL